ncbi:MAG: amidohydrolase family protein [Polyangiaceae bacterium]
MPIRGGSHDSRRWRPAAGHRGWRARRAACGTDIGCFPHAAGSLAELGAMVDLGMSAERALFAATGAAAELLRMPERGRIAAGAIADLAVFDLPEGAELAAAWKRRPALVIQAGRVVRG